jgi:hypothetical protein
MAAVAIGARIADLTIGTDVTGATTINIGLGAIWLAVSAGGDLTTRRRSGAIASSGVTANEARAISINTGTVMTIGARLARATTIDVGLIAIRRTVIAIRELAGIGTTTQVALAVRIDDTGVTGLTTRARAGATAVDIGLLTVSYAVQTGWCSTAWRRASTLANGTRIANAAGAVRIDIRAVVAIGTDGAGSTAIDVGLVRVGVLDTIRAIGHLTRYVAHTGSAVVASVARVAIHAPIRARAATVDVGLILVLDAIITGSLCTDANIAV